MNMIPARDGTLWLRQGLMLFGRQPGALSLLFVLWTLCAVLVSYLPDLLGVPLLLVLTAVYPPVMMRAFDLAEQGERVTPRVLAAAAQRKRLPAQVALSVIYVLLCLLAVQSMLSIGGPLMVDIITGKVKPEPKTIEGSHILAAYLTMLAITTPASLLFWFSTTVANWNGSGVIKSLFFTAVSVWRGLLAFLMLGVGLMAICFLLVAFLMIVQKVIGGGQILLSLLTPMIATVVQGALYAAYIQLIGKPQQDTGSAP